MTQKYPHDHDIVGWEPNHWFFSWWLLWILGGLLIILSIVLVYILITGHVPDSGTDAQDVISNQLWEAQSDYKSIVSIRDINSKLRSELDSHDRNYGMSLMWEGQLENDQNQLKDYVDKYNKEVSEINPGDLGDLPERLGPDGNPAPG